MPDARSCADPANNSTMESPRTGIILLALVAVTTAAGGLLGWTLRAQGTPVEAGRVVLPVVREVAGALPAAELVAGDSATAVATPVDLAAEQVPSASR